MLNELYKNISKHFLQAGSRASEILYSMKLMIQFKLYTLWLAVENICDQLADIMDTPQLSATSTQQFENFIYIKLVSQKYDLVFTDMAKPWWNLITSFRTLHLFLHFLLNDEYNREAWFLILNSDFFFLWGSMAWYILSPHVQHYDRPETRSGYPPF